MERLITHLQQTLDDDEAAKDALLMLRTGSAESMDSPSQENDSERRILIEENSNIFILQSVLSRILKDSVLPIDLPIKIAAMHLDISPKLMRDLCATQTIYTTWSTKFSGCFKQVLDIHQWFVENKCLLISSAQEAKLQFLQQEVKRMKEEPYGAGFEHSLVLHFQNSFTSYPSHLISVARFILSTVVDFVSTRAVPLPLQLPSHPLGTAPLPPLGTREIDLRELVINPSRLGPTPSESNNSNTSNSSGARGPQRREEDPDMKVILLAPLELKPRSTKHL